MAVMGRGDIVVGKDQAPLNPRQSIVAADQTENAGRPRPPKPRQQQMCGAMSEQRADSGAYSQPQGFVRLVGYRAPKVKPPVAPS
jgi:hypothetical protein